MAARGPPTCHSDRVRLAVDPSGPPSEGNARTGWATARRRALAWVGETAVVGICYKLYSLTANVAPRQRAVALAHTEMLLQLERHAHLNIELYLNRLWAGSPLRMGIGNYYYDVMHFLVPLLVLGWLSSRPASEQRPFLLALAGASILALSVFWMWPAAPPRLLPGSHFVDTVARVPTLGSGGSHGMAAAENPYAAVPSLHVTWALWSAVCVARLSQSRRFTALAALHVAATTLIIVLTGNHLLIDAAAGGLALAGGFVLAATVSACARLLRSVSQHYGGVVAAAPDESGVDCHP